MKVPGQISINDQEVDLEKVIGQYPKRQCFCRKRAERYGPPPSAIFMGLPEYFKFLILISVRPIRFSLV